jgi:hypothetical protein
MRDRGQGLPETSIGSRPPYPVLHRCEALGRQAFVKYPVLLEFRPCPITKVDGSQIPLVIQALVNDCPYGLRNVANKRP